VNTNNLERVRTCKSRLVRLVTRVETIREVLEKFLDDDSDMHAMHLTARALDQLERKTSFLQVGLRAPRVTFSTFLSHHLVAVLILCSHTSIRVCSSMMHLALL
jgi:hypothetical protein